MAELLKLLIVPIGRFLNSKPKSDRQTNSIEYLAFMICVLVIVMVWHLLLDRQMSSKRCVILETDTKVAVKKK